MCLLQNKIEIKIDGLVCLFIIMLFFQCFEQKKIGRIWVDLWAKIKKWYLRYSNFLKYNSRFGISKKYRRIVSGQTLTCCHNHLIKLQCDTAIYRALLAHFIFSRKCLYRNVVQATKQSNKFLILTDHKQMKINLYA